MGIDPVDDYWATSALKALRGAIGSDWAASTRNLPVRQRPQSLERRHLVQMVQKVQRIVIHPQRAGALQFTDIVAPGQ